MTIPIRLMVVVCLWFCCQASARAQVKLRWKLDLGDKLAIERVYEQKQEIEVKGKAYPQETTSRWLTQVVVKEKTAGHWTLDLTLADVSFKNAGVGHGALDDKLAARLKGQSFGIMLTRDGVVKKLMGYDELVKKLAEGKTDVEKTVRAVLSEDGLKEGCAEMFGFLPQRGVAVGDKWKRETLDPVPPFGGFVSVFEYEYQGKKEGLDAIGYTIKTNYEKPREHVELFRVVKGSLTGDEGQGYYLFDAAAGRLNRGEKSMIVRGQVTVEVGGVATELRFVSANRLTVRMVEGK